MNNNVNPYDPPESPTHLDPLPPSRVRTMRRCVRGSLLLLLAPGLHNFCELETPIGRNDVHLSPVGMINLLGIVTLTITVWFYGLELIVWAAEKIRAYCAPRVTRADWQRPVTRALGRALRASLMGAAVWFAWNLAYFHWHADFTTVSLVAGIPAHLLAAAVYLPLMLDWFRLVRDASPERLTA